MSLTDFLGALGSSISAGGAYGEDVMAGRTPGASPMTTPTAARIDPLDITAQQMQQAGQMGGVSGFTGVSTPNNGGQVAQQTPALRKQRSGISDFLGKLGDAIMVGAGGEPIYQKKVEREQLGEQLAQLIGTNDPKLAEFIRTNPEVGMQLFKMRQPGEGYTLGPGQIRYGPDGRVISQAPGRDGASDPTFVRELEALGIDPRSPEARELFYGRNSPAGYLLRPKGGASAPQGAAPGGGGGPAPGTVVGGFQFKGGNPNDRNSWAPMGGGGGNATGGF